MFKRICLPVLIVLSVIITACAEKSTPTPVPVNDLLAKILARGTIVIATDSEYPPQSVSVPGAKRLENTKCSQNESTANQFTGFDVDSAIEIATRLGVEACFVTPQWSQLISGNWDDRWDISIGSMAITEERMKALYFTQPYYSTPASIFVHKDNTTFSTPADLSGKRVGACTGCGYEDYLRGKLVMPNNPIEYVVIDAEIVGYQIDLPALEDLAIGDGVNVDGVLTGQPTGLEAIKNGLPIKLLGDPVYFEYLAAAVDKKSGLDSLGLAVRITEIIREMHTDGALVEISMKYYDVDYATIASQFDVKPLGQLP